MPDHGYMVKTKAYNDHVVDKLYFYEVVSHLGRVRDDDEVVHSVYLGECEPLWRSSSLGEPGSLREASTLGEASTLRETSPLREASTLRVHGRRCSVRLSGELVLERLGSGVS